MDWTLAINLNRMALLRILGAVAVMIGGGGMAGTVPRHVHRAVAAVLRPAEAATRRLIAVVMLKTDATTPVPVGARRSRAGKSVPRKKEQRTGVSAFRLFDPRIDVDPKRKSAPGCGPRLRFLDGVDERDATGGGRPRQPQPDDPVSDRRLRDRMQALTGALNDLDAQARRLARATARMTRRIRPMRPGRAPGQSVRGKREIDAILYECACLAEMAYGDARKIDTS